MLLLVSLSLTFFLLPPAPPRSTLFPYTTLFRSLRAARRPGRAAGPRHRGGAGRLGLAGRRGGPQDRRPVPQLHRSEEHTSELQSRRDLVCRLLLEKKKNQNRTLHTREYAYHIGH